MRACARKGDAILRAMVDEPSAATAGSEVQPVEPIRTDEAHEQALAEIRALWDSAPGSRDERRLDVLVTAVCAYEEVRWPIGPPNMDGEPT